MTEEVGYGGDAQTDSLTYDHCLGTGADGQTALPQVSKDLRVARQDQSAGSMNVREKVEFQRCNLVLRHYPEVKKAINQV